MKFLTVDEVIEAHSIVTENDLDDPAVMNAGAVASAIDRSQWGHYETGDIAERAAYLIRGICQDHAFTNGNKRAAFAAADAFLLLNNHVLVAGADEVVEFMLSVAQDELTIQEMAEWVRIHTENL